MGCHRGWLQLGLPKSKMEMCRRNRSACAAASAAIRLENPQEHSQMGSGLAVVPACSACLGAAGMQRVSTQESDSKGDAHRKDTPNTKLSEELWPEQVCKSLTSKVVWEPNATASKNASPEFLSRPSLPTASCQAPQMSYTGTLGSHQPSALAGWILSNPPCRGR